MKINSAIALTISAKLTKTNHLGPELIRRPTCRQQLPRLPQRRTAASIRASDEETSYCSSMLLGAMRDSRCRSAESDAVSISEKHNANQCTAQNHQSRQEIETMKTENGKRLASARAATQRASEGVA
jgi:hypothetical protein